MGTGTIGGASDEPEDVLRAPGGPPGAGGGPDQPSAGTRGSFRDATPEQRAEWGRRAAATRAAKRAGASAPPAGDQADTVRLRVDAGKKSKADPAQVIPSANEAAASLQAEAAAGLIVMTIETAASAVLAIDARLNPLERPMVVPPAGRMLARMDAAQLGRFAAVADPVTLLAGLAIWGARIWSIKAIAAQQANAEGRERARLLQQERERAAHAAASVVRTPSPPAANGGAVTTNGTSGVAPAPADIAAMLDTE